MNWFRIPKELSSTPNHGSNYKDWKEDLSIEGREQCVYCSINIKSFGGIRNFHVEHYKPKAKDKFPELENEFSNLFFACSICNCFKGDDWPNEPTKRLDIPAYPDPSIFNYSDFLYLDDSFLVESEKPTGIFLIQKLFLNRPQLLLERKSYFLHEVLKTEIESLKEVILRIKSQKNTTLILETMIALIDTVVILIKGNYINPYTTEQTKR